MKNSHLINQFLKKFALDMRHRKRVRIFAADSQDSDPRNLEFSVDDLRFTMIPGTGEDGRIRIEIPVMGSLPGSFSEMKALMSLNSVLGPAFLSERDGQIFLTWARPPRYFDYSELCLAIEEMSSSKKELETRLLASYGIDQSMMITDSMKGISRLCLPRNREMADMIQEISEAYPEPLKSLWARVLSCDEPIEASFRTMELLGVLVRIMVFLAIGSIEGGIPAHAALSRTLTRYSMREWFSLGEILTWKHEMGPGPAQSIKRIFERVRRNGLSSEEPSITGVVDAMSAFEEMILGVQKNSMDPGKIQSAFRENLENLCLFMKMLFPLFGNSGFETRLSGGEQDMVFRNTYGEKSLRPFAMPLTNSASGIAMALFDGWTKVAGRAKFISIPGFEKTRIKPGPLLESLDPSRICDSPSMDESILIGYYPSVILSECGTLDPFQGPGLSEKWVHLISRDDSISRHSMISHIQRKASCVHFTAHDEKAQGCLLSILNQLLPERERENSNSTDLWTLRREICLRGQALIQEGRLKDEVIIAVHRPDLSPGLMAHLRGLCKDLPQGFKLLSTGRKPVLGACNRECPPLHPSALIRATGSFREARPISNDFMDRLMINARREGVAYCHWVIQEICEGRMAGDNANSLPETMDQALSLSLKQLVSRKGGAGCRNLLALCSAMGGRVGNADAQAIIGEDPSGTMGDLLLELEPFILVAGAWSMALETPEITQILSSLLKEQTDRMRKDLRAGMENARGENLRYISRLLEMMPSSQDQVEQTVSMLIRRTRNDQLTFAEMRNTILSIAAPRGSAGIWDNLRVIDLLRMGRVASELFFSSEFDRFLMSLDQLLEAAEMSSRISSPELRALSSARMMARLLASQSFASSSAEIRDPWIRLLRESILESLKNPDSLAPADLRCRILEELAITLPPCPETADILSRVMILSGDCMSPAIAPHLQEIFKKSGRDAFVGLLSQMTPPAPEDSLRQGRGWTPSCLAGAHLAPEQIMQIWKARAFLAQDPWFLAWSAPRIASRDPVMATQMAETISPEAMEDFQNLRFRTLCRIAVAISQGNLKRALEILNGMEIKKRMWDLNSRIYMVCDALLDIASTLASAQRKSIVNQAMQLLENHISLDQSSLERVKLAQRMTRASEVIFEVDLRAGEELLNKTLGLLDFSMGSSNYCEFLLRLAQIAKSQGLPVQRELISRALKVMKGQRIAREAELLGLLVTLAPAECCGCLEHIPAEERQRAYQAMMDSLDPVRYREIGENLLRAVLQINDRTQRMQELFYFLRSSIPHSSRLADSIMAALGNELKRGLPDELTHLMESFSDAHPNAILYYPQLLQKSQSGANPEKLLRCFSRIFETNPMDSRKNIGIAMGLFNQAMNQMLSDQSLLSRLEEIRSMEHPVQRFMALARFLQETQRTMECEVIARNLATLAGMESEPPELQDFDNLREKGEPANSENPYTPSIEAARAMLSRLALEIAPAIREEDAPMVISALKALLQDRSPNLRGNDRSKLSRSLEIIVSRHPIDPEAAGMIASSEQGLFEESLQLLAREIGSGGDRKILEEQMARLRGLSIIHPEDLLKIFRTLGSSSLAMRILMDRPVSERESLFRIAKATRPEGAPGLLFTCSELFFDIRDGLETGNLAAQIQSIGAEVDEDSLLDLLETLFHTAERSRERCLVLEQVIERARENPRPYWKIFDFLRSAAEKRDMEAAARILDFIVTDFHQMEAWLERFQTTGLLTRAGFRQSLLLATNAIHGLVAKK